MDDTALSKTKSVVRCREDQDRETDSRNKNKKIRLKGKGTTLYEVDIIDQNERMDTDKDANDSDTLVGQSVSSLHDVAARTLSTLIPPK